MYTCLDCGEVFREPETRYDTYESYYGVSGEFGSSTSMSYGVCPCCGSEEIEEGMEVHAYAIQYFLEDLPEGVCVSDLPDKEVVWVCREEDIEEALTDKIGYNVESCKIEENF